jgi:signal transduction histidine kinase
MVVAGRRKSIAFFIALGAGLILVTLLLYVGWVLLGWKNGILIFFSVLLVMLIISGVVLNTIFLVREIRRNAQHDAFINAVTHELKTPVASIRLYLETLQTRPVEEQKRQEFYRTMLADSDRLLATIEQVLRTGRIGNSGRVLNRSAVELDPMIATCLERVRTMHHVNESAIEFKSGDPLTVLCDPDELSAAIMNLVDNAFKYSGKEARVWIDTENLEGKFARIRVRDNGPGIPKPELKQIFKRFYRVAGPQATRVKGTGLGLYIVRSVAKRHGGRAWAESEGPGKGSTFVLQLPLARKTAEYERPLVDAAVPK